MNTPELLLTYSAEGLVTIQQRLEAMYAAGFVVVRVNFTGTATTEDNEDRFVVNQEHFLVGCPVNIEDGKMIFEGNGVRTVYKSVKIDDDLKFEFGVITSSSLDVKENQ